MPRIRKIADRKTTRWCTAGEHWQPFRLFGLLHPNQDRMQVYKSHCNECLAKQARLRYRPSTGKRAGIGGQPRKYK